MKTNMAKKNKREDRNKASVMYNVPVKDRQAKGVEIVWKKLEELGFTCIAPEKKHQDMICVKGNCRIPIQAKPLPLTRTNDQTCVADKSLKDFIGIYVVWVEQALRKSAFLHIPDPIFREIVHRANLHYSHVGKIRPHDRWWLYIPRSLRGFEQFADDTIPDRYYEDNKRLIRELRRYRPKP